MTTATVDGIAAGIDETLRKCLSHMLEIAEIDVITLALSRQQCVHRVMEVIVPLRIEAVSTEFGRSNNASIVKGTFGNHIYAAIQTRAARVDGIGKLFQNI